VYISIAQLLPEELETLLDNLDSIWVRFVIEFALLSAKRHGEILNLMKDDIDHRNRTIWIHSTQRYRVKFNKEQHFPLSESIMCLLNRVERAREGLGIESDFLFVDDKGRQLTEKKVQEHIKAARELGCLAGHVTMHAMRRTSATRIKQNRATTNSIKGLLNHESERTTTQYIGSPKIDEAKALNSLGLDSFLPPNEP
jgi:integrase/recombinase XerC